MFSSDVAAQQLNLGVNEFSNSTALGGGSLQEIISRVVNIFLGFLGILTVCIMLYGGFMWMTSGGDEKKVTNARQIIINGLIGLVIVLSSWAITLFVLNALLGATTGEGIGGGGAGAGAEGGGGLSFDDLGSGNIKSYYPSRNAVNVPRNTPIIITFKKPVNPSTLITGTGLNSTTVRIHKRGSTVNLGVDDVVATKSDDNTTFTFRPKSPIGSATETVTYVVSLTAGVTMADATPAFRRPPYEWSFDVSTVLDLTPPKITSVMPSPESVGIPRNMIVQVSFDEPLDPSSATVQGALSVKNMMGLQSVAGNLKFSNNYRTIEFVPSEACGTNSCGKTVFCLPAGSGDKPNLEITVKAATLDGRLPAPAAAQPVDGVTDVVGNSLDGNRDGKGAGPALDNYVFTIGTSNVVRTTPPELLSVSPSVGTGSVPFNAPITMLFSPTMSFETLSSDNIFLKASAGEPGYSIRSENQAATGASKDGTTIATIDHRLFGENIVYQTQLGSGLKDSYQNCFAPIAGPGCTTTSEKPYCCSSMTGVSPQAAPCSSPAT